MEKIISKAHYVAKWISLALVLSLYISTSQAINWVNWGVKSDLDFEICVRFKSYTHN